MRWLWPHLRLRLYLAVMAISWLCLILLLLMATMMVLERPVWMELSNEAVVDGAWQRSATCVHWESPRLQVHQRRSDAPHGLGPPLVGTVRRFIFERGIFDESSPFAATSEWSFCGIAWECRHHWRGLTLFWPYPLLVLALLALPALRQIYRWLVCRYRIPASACPTCGYDLRATPDRCPECGAAVTFDPRAGRYCLAVPRRRSMWPARIWMATSIAGIIAVLGIWNGPGWGTSGRGRGPHLWLLQHQAICWYRYASPSTTGFSGEWHRATLGLWAQLDSSTIVLWIPYWLPLALAAVAPLRAIWRRIRYGPMSRRSPTRDIPFQISPSPSATTAHASIDPRA